MLNSNDNDSALKITLFNILGFVSGIITNIIVWALLRFVFIGVLGKIKFITAFISWPVDYEYYALVTIVLGAAFSGAAVCSFICNKVIARYNYAIIVYGLGYFLLYIVDMIMYLVNYGFSFSYLLVGIISAAAYFDISIQFSENN